MALPCTKKTALFAAIGIVSASLNANAQSGDSLDVQLPGLTSYAPSTSNAPLNGVQTQTLTLEARLTEETDPLSDGMIWRVFNARPGVDGNLPLVAVYEGGQANIDLPEGDYLVHAAFGRAGATSRVVVGADNRSESLVLNAGGLQLNAVLPDGSSMRQNKLNFDIYKKLAGQEDQLIAPAVPAGHTIRLNAGTYHVVSKYGKINATTRADLRVEAGKTTEATIEHRAAQVTLNLVRSKSGFPMADTAWSVVTQSGEIIKEDVGAVPSMILSAGEYTVFARNKDRIYQQDIQVIAGRDLTIRVEAVSDNEIEAAN